MPKAPRQRVSESTRKSLPRLKDMNMRCRPETASKTDPKYTLSFQRIEAKGWDFFCICTNVCYSRSSILRHAKRCEDVQKVIAKALRTGEDIAYEFMTVVMKKETDDDSLKSIRHGQHDSADVQHSQDACSVKTEIQAVAHNTNPTAVESQALMMQFERVLTQTEEILAEQRSRDQWMDIVFEEQISRDRQMDMVFKELRSRDGQIDMVFKELRSRDQQMDMVVAEQLDSQLELARDFRSLAKDYAARIRSDLHEAKQERDVMRQDIRDLFREVEALKDPARRCTDAQTAATQTDPATGEEKTCDL
ncbi:hypothetical protein EDD21DRAFT_383028 [Dissophora ornata]|nr:hypothetical protein BGZ58_000787 [Dissophora ornata]KAI8598240.1 hypothetical protein EDD21DRAFT_383028 [Dissophora ornata]